MMEEEREPSRQEVRGDQNAISMYGDASVHLHLPPVPPGLPEQVWMVPYRRNPFFTGREDLLKTLHERFMRDQAAVLMQGQAINGLGGIGKTQIAVEYAYRYQQDYRFVLWASAASQETLRAAYISMADRLHLPKRDAQEQEKIVAAVMHWLSTHEGWLLNVDNADDMEMIWPMLPTGSMGHLLLTTRDQVVGGMERFEVEPMNCAEGTLLLLRRAGMLKAEMTLEQLPQADRDSTEQIVIEMGGLPLALDQAGAYIEEAQCSLQDYVAAYHQHRSRFLADHGRLADHPAAVATTWALSFERVEQRTPAAADLLRVCAFLAPDAIPEEIIIKGAKHLGPRLHPIETEPSVLQKMLKALRAYSLIHRDIKEKTLSVHRLVQAVIQDSLEEAERRTWAERAMLAVNANAVFPCAEHGSWSQGERLLPQALEAAHIIDQYQVISEEAGDLLHETAFYLMDRACYAEAELLFRRTLHIWEQKFGPEHSHVAYPLNNLAIVLRWQGKHEQAELLFQRALHIWEQQLGPKHPDVAHALDGLASIYLEQGRYAEAEPLYERALSIWKQTLGPEDPLVAYPLNNLAELYYEQGKYEQAGLLFQRALHIREQALGPKHPDTAATMHDFAQFREGQDNGEEASAWYARALAVREQVLGTHHPETVKTRKRFIALLHALGQHEKAIQLETAQSGP